MSLTEKLAEQYAQLAVLKACEVELTDGPDAALQTLGPPADPIRFRAALAIRVQAGRYVEAAGLIRERVPDERWIDIAAAVFAHLEDLEQAQRLVDRADECSDRLVRLRTRLGFAEGVLERWQQRRKGESLLGPGSWPASEIEAGKKVIDILDPLLCLVRANGRIENGLELAAVKYGVYCAQVVDDRSLLRQCSTSLIKYVPVPLIVAEICLRRLIECPGNLPVRLCAENPGDFQAGFLAALVDRDLLNHPENAFDGLVRLASQARTHEERDSVSAGLFETCGKCFPPRIDQAITVLRDLRPNDSRQLSLLEVFRKMSNKDLVGARAELDSIRDDADGVWWQAQAQLCEFEGNEGDAQHAWEEASKRLPHPDVVRRSVQASLDQRRFESAIRDLKKLLVANPNDQRSLWAISLALAHTGDYAHAAEYLERLVERDPSQAKYRISLAQCFGRSAQTTKAISVLEPLCSTDGAPVEAILIQSELLTGDGRPKEAFDLLRRIAGDHWDEPEFLLRYMDGAHAAEQEQLAHEAFVRLLELQHAGKVAPELLQEKSLDDLLEHGRRYGEIRQNLQNAVVAGRVPWLAAEEQMRNPPTWAWALHTQELKWNVEEPLSRAAFSIYATNGFTVCATDNGKTIETITSPERGSEVVVDLSALLTLHAIHRLEEVAGFFGTLILPASYGDLRRRHGALLVDHQPSRKSELQRIRAKVEAKRIRVISDVLPGLLSVDEYSDVGDRCVYRLSDLIPPLERAQKAAPELVRELLDVAQKVSIKDVKYVPLEIGAPLLIDLPTLRALAGQRIFEVVVDAFTVHLRTGQWDEVVGELDGYRIAAGAKDSHFALWDSVKHLMKAGTVRFEPVRMDTDRDLGAEKEDLCGVYLDSWALARSLAKPLLADDRVLQVLMYQEDTGSVSRACDSSKALVGMLSAGVLTCKDTAEGIRRLMQWRYRFLVPPPEILFELALGAAESPPGDALLDVAFYLHDCLRDPGLHCGLEQSEPPLPMAVKLAAEWGNAITAFLPMVWRDSRFSEDAASRLTRWVGEEFLPSCPRGLASQPMGYNLARAERLAMMAGFMVHFAVAPDRRRANLALRILAETSGMDQDSFLTATAEAINAIK